MRYEGKEKGSAVVVFTVIIAIGIIAILIAAIIFIATKNTGLLKDPNAQTVLEQAEEKAKSVIAEKYNESGANIQVSDMVSVLQQNGYTIESDSMDSITADNIKFTSEGKDISNNCILTLPEEKSVAVVIDFGRDAHYYLVYNKRSYEISVQNSNLTIAREVTKRKSLKEKQIPILQTAISSSSAIDLETNDGQIHIKANVPGSAEIKVTMSNNLIKVLPVKVQFSGIEKDGNRYTWDDIDKFAKNVKADPNVNSDSDEAGPYVINENELTLAVGDQGIVLDDAGKSYNVRILGFKSDELADGSGKAGISFEFVTSLGNYIMNSINSNKNGWAETDLRIALNGGKKRNESEVSDNDATVSKLSNYKNIKSVKKKYIATYNVAKTSVCNDKLWLLASGEIWDNGFTNGARGVAITDESTEGKQYRYYKVNLKDTSYNVNNSVTKKPNTDSPVWWWLRSPLYGNQYTFCYVHKDGFGSSSGYSSIRGAVFPGFCI